MKEDTKKLKQTIASLEGELRASMVREELLEEQLKAPKKDSWLRQKINDPGSKFGKIIRLPRTIYRIARYPDVRREMRGEEPIAKEKTVKEKTGKYEKQEDKIEFAPVKFFHSEDTTFRVNLVVKELQKEVLKVAIEFANKCDYELRVVTYGEKAGVEKYRKFKNEKSFPKAKKINFYSSVDQAKRKNPFELEIGKNDLFLMNEWGINGKE